MRPALADSPKSAHIWLPDTRSLCDRRSRPRPLRDAELPAAIAETDVAPSCGPCLLLVSRLRRQASVLLKTNPTVWPERPSQAWAELRETRWGRELDIDRFLERTDLDSGIRYDAVNLAVDEGSVQQLLSWRNQARDEALAEVNGRLRRGESAGDSAQP